MGGVQANALNRREDERRERENDRIEANRKHLVGSLFREMEVQKNPLHTGVQVISRRIQMRKFL